MKPGVEYHGLHLDEASWQPQFVRFYLPGKFVWTHETEDKSISSCLYLLSVLLGL